MVSFGGVTSTFSVFINPLQTDLGWSRTGINAAFTIFLFSTALTAPFAGRLVEGFGARKVISTGSIVTIAGLVLLSRMNSIWHLYIGYLVVGIGIAATGPVTLSYIVSHWFRIRRGMAIGIMSMGMSLSGILFPPLIAILVISYLGWREAYLTMAIINLGVVIPLSIFVIRTKPADLGLYPDGIKEALEMDNEINKPSPASEGIPLKSALFTAAFWLIAISLLFNHTHLGVYLSVFPHLRDMGFPVDIAASTISITSAMALVGMFLFGWLCDRIKAKYASAIGLFLIALAIVMFMSFTPHSPVWWVWLYSIVMGFGIGSWLPTMSILTSTTFGLASYGSVFGIMSFFQNSGGGIGPLIAGYVYDTTHSYNWAAVIIFSMVVIAIPLVLAVRKPVHTTVSEYCA
jgi:MFS family permease